MYSIDHVLKRVYNLQTKWILLQWLKNHDADKPSMGLEYKFHSYSLVHIY